MTAISPFSPVPEDRHISLLSTKKNSMPDVNSVAESQMRAPMTSGTSADDSRGLTTPECDFIDVKATSASRWASVQEALETCLDPFFLAGQSSVKDDGIVEELTLLLDTSLTAHVPAVAGLTFLQPFFTGCTRSERLDAVLHAARVSNKLLVRDDLPVPSSSGWMLSVDEAEAAGLRVGPRSHAEGVNRSLLSLERRHSSVDCDEVVRSLTDAQLQATVPHHRIVKVERMASTGAVRAVFVSPTAADRAYAMWRAHAPHSDLRVTRGGGGAAAASPARMTPTPPRPASDIRAAAAATALRCPRVVGEMPSRPASVDDLMTLAGTKATPAAAPAPRVAMPKPPMAIDAALPTTAAAAVPHTASSDANTTSTTPSPEGSTGKSKFNMNAAPFLPKGVIEAQMATTGVSVAGRWVSGGSRPRRVPGCEDVVSASSMDTSEALANQLLKDPNTGWMYPAMDGYNTPSWANKFTAVDGWADSTNMGNDAQMIACTLTAYRRESPAMPARPMVVGGDMPVAPCALGNSPRGREPHPVGGMMRGGNTQYDLCPPQPVTVGLPPKHSGSSCCCGYDAGASYPTRTSPLSQTSPVPLSTSRRHRHDPYSPSGFVLCSESSCASSFSHPAPAAAAVTAVSPASQRLLFAGSTKSERMAAIFCFEDPLVHASARRRERRRHLQRAAEESGEMGEAALTSSSSSSEGSALSGLEVRREACECGNESESGGVREPCQATAAFSAADEVATPPPAAATTAATVPEEAGAVVPVPKSYAEALRLKAKAGPPAITVLAVRPAKVESSEKPGKTTRTHATAAGASAKVGAVKGKTAMASAATSPSTSKKAAAAV